MVGKIALGVFLGNLAFALLAWLALSVMFDNRQAAADAQLAHERFNALATESTTAPPVENRP